MYFYLDRTSLKKIGEEIINKKDLRTIRRWCKKNHLLIFKDASGEFVYTADLDLVCDGPLILRLKQKYGNGWLEYYKAYLNGELLNMLDFGTDTKNAKSDYIPKGQFASRISRKSA